MAITWNAGAVGVVQPRRSLLKDLNSANVAAGVTAGLFYMFGAIPLFLSAAQRLNLSAAETTSWFFITFMTSAVSSLALSLVLRVPLPIGWSMPGLVFLATMGGQYSHGEMVGAFLAAGLLIIAFGALGVGDHLMRLLPLPIVMGMFAGNVLAYVTGVFTSLDGQPWFVGAAIAGYLISRAWGRIWLPPMFGAVVAGLVAAGVGGQINTAALHWSAPTVTAIRPEFDVGSLAALTIPLVVMAIGMGNVQGLGVLLAQGFKPPVAKVTALMGVTTLINAVFGGHVSSIQNNGAAILGGPDAGPREQRYVASAIASVIAIGLALCAATAGSLLGLLPPGLVPALAGLALISSMMDALHKATRTDLSMGAFFALMIAASGLTILGIGPAFWALVGGMLVSLVLERPALVAAWRMGGPPRQETTEPTPDRGPSPVQPQCMGMLQPCPT
jgi:benzoate membrane transport protein